MNRETNYYPLRNPQNEIIDDFSTNDEALTNPNDKK